MIEEFMDDQKSKNNKGNFKQKSYRQNDSKNNNGNNNRFDGKFHRDNSQRGGKFDFKDRQGHFSSSPQRSFSKYDQSKDVDEFPKRTQNPKKRLSSSSFLHPMEHDDFAEHELTKRRNKNRYENKKKKRNRYDDDFDDFGWN